MFPICKVIVHNFKGFVWETVCFEFRYKKLVLNAVKDVQSVSTAVHDFPLSICFLHFSVIAIIEY